MDEKVVPVGRHIPEVVHTWSRPCHLPFEQWSVRLVLNPGVCVLVLVKVPCVEIARTVRCLPMLLVLHLRFAGSHIDRVLLP
jgi:hypothetical protein